MNIGIIGLGKMGAALADRLLKAGHKVFGYDLNEQMQEHARAFGVQLVQSVDELPKHVEIIWLMVPAGTLVDAIIAELKPHCTNHILIDGGNSNFKDSVRRAAILKADNIQFLDVGTSGGLKGHEIGFSLMIGGDSAAFVRAEPIFKAIAIPQGYGLVGPAGAGHYVKMVHNGIEYALMQAYAEGFHLIKDGYFKEADIDLAKVTDIWLHGSIIRSYILELAHTIFKEDQQFEAISGSVAESGMGKWTVEEAHEHHIPVQTIEDALKIRAVSRETGGNYATKIVALLRHAFGGHAVTKSN